MNLDGLNIDKANGKHLFGSLIDNGSVVVIGAIVGLAILAAVIIFWRKKKKGQKGKKENE